jgi:hypothetical protein
MTLFQNLILFTNHCGNLQEMLEMASFIKYVDLYLTSEWGRFYVGHLYFKIQSIQERKQQFTITEVNLLTLFKVVIAVNFDNNTKHKCRFSCHYLFKQVRYMINIGLKSLIVVFCAYGMWYLSSRKGHKLQLKTKEGRKYSELRSVK